MNIYNLDRIISESIKKAIYLMEAERVVCQGNEEWVDFNNEVKKFITLVESFDISFKSLIGKINNGGDLSNHARKCFEIITRANNCIFKERKYGFRRSELHSRFQKPIELMYTIKSAMGTSLLLLIMNNKELFPKIESFLRSDEKDRRIIDIRYNGYDIDYYHMPEKLQDIYQLCSGIDSNFVLRPEDSIDIKGNPNPNYDKLADTYKSSITNDYLKPLEILKNVVENFENSGNKRLQQQRLKAAQEGINKGFIIPVFGNEDLPCVIKMKVKGKDAYNAIPSALQNTKNDYLIKDNKTNNIIWFKTYEVNNDSIDFLDSIIGTYMASVSKDGNVECVSDELNEMIRKIVKQILNESRYGI